MAKAKKLPSGSWRCLVYSHSEVQYNKDGKPALDAKGKQKQKRIYESFTSDDPSPAGKREAELAAAQFAVDKKSHTIISKKTFGDALDDYIKDRSSVLSPGTIREYKRIRRANIQALMDVRLCDITQDMIQKIINDEAKNRSPKTVRNIHGLISAVLKTYRPDFALNTDLPKAVRPKIYVPSDAEVQTLMEYIKDDVMEIPILLAAFGPMRRGEICALDSSHIKGNIVHVEFSIALDENNQWIRKTPKSYAGDRYIEYPNFVIEKLPTKGKVTDLNPSQITDRFIDILKRAGIQHFRFHDLRHPYVKYTPKNNLRFFQCVFIDITHISTHIFKKSRAQLLLSATVPSILIVVLFPDIPRNTIIITIYKFFVYAHKVQLF